MGIKNATISLKHDNINKFCLLDSDIDTKFHLDTVSDEHTLNITFLMFRSYRVWAPHSENKKNVNYKSQNQSRLFICLKEEETCPILAS